MYEAPASSNEIYSRRWNCNISSVYICLYAQFVLEIVEKSN